MMTIEAATALSLASLLISTYIGLENLKRGKNADTQKDATQMTTVMVKLDALNSTMLEIKSEITNTKSDIKDILERLVVVEQSSKSAHKRLDDYSIK